MVVKQGKQPTLDLERSVGLSYSSTLMYPNLHLNHFSPLAIVSLHLSHSITHKIFIECSPYANTIPVTGGARMIKGSV